MATSILDSTKKLLGLDMDYDVFDLDVLTHINTVFFTLQQLGVGPADGFFIEDNTKNWEDYDTVGNLNAVRSYMFIRVRLLFDPPATSFAIDSLKKQAEELEWRLNVQQESIRHPLDPSGRTI